MDYDYEMEGGGEKKKRGHRDHKQVIVRGYRKKDGTKVKSYKRTIKVSKSKKK